MTMQPSDRPLCDESLTSVAEPPRLVVGIATTGRAAILADTVHDLVRQSKLPDLLVLSVAESGDLAPGCGERLPFPVRVVQGAKGLTRQRNRVLDCLRPADVLVFLDDDYLLAPDFLEACAALFADHPDIVMATGKVLADGVSGPGLSFDEGRAALAGTQTPGPRTVEPTHSGYGCNMAMRAAPILAHGLRFDENLPLYGWLEDVDFTRQLVPHGRLVKAAALRGVHLGTKSGRTPGRRLGYSQVVNPVYLARKGTISWAWARHQIGHNIAANIVYSLWPRPWTDSRGRLRGNLRAVADMVRRTDSPGRILEL